MTPSGSHYNFSPDKRCQALYAELPGVQYQASAMITTSLFLSGYVPVLPEAVC